MADFSAGLVRREAAALGFRPDTLEKVARLLELLEIIRRDRFLASRLVLKGGTALNLFLFDVPRLSVDIDLNYIGGADVETMQTERPRIEDTLQRIASRAGLQVRHVPNSHAGGKWVLPYRNAHGTRDEIRSISTTCSAYPCGIRLRWIRGPSARSTPPRFRCWMSTSSPPVS